MENVIPFRKAAPMISLDYKTLNSQEFNQALATLAMQKDFANFQASYNVAKFIRKFDSELKTARELYAKFTKEYIETEEDGKPIASASPHPYCPWKIKEEKQEEFNKKMDDFLSTKVEIQAYPIKANDLGSIKLSPHQVLALEPIFDPSVFEQESLQQST